MPDMPEHPPDAFPKPARKVRIEEPFKDIELTTHYRGKTNGYVVDRKWVHTILDRSGQTVVPQWTDDWTEIAPGIETRREDRSTRSRVGNQNYETHISGSLRIHRHACPVHVEFGDIHEFIDYDDIFSTRDHYEYWVCYEA